VNDTEKLIVLGALLLIFGWIGFKRGVRAELGTLALILGTQILMDRKGDLLVDWINKLYRAFLFAFKGGLGADDPGAVFAAVRKAPPLISQDFQPHFSVAVTVAAVVLAYIVIGRLRPFVGKASFLGGLLGLINGYLVIHLFLSRLPIVPDPLNVLTGRTPIASSAQVRAATTPVRWFLVVRSIQPEKRGGGQG